MFGKNKDKDQSHKKLIENRNNFLFILNNLVGFLEASNNLGQSKNVKKAIDLINDYELEKFIKYINGVDFWGGSGSVWEVFIKDNSAYKDFCIEIVKLIDLLEESDSLGKGIKSIKKLLINNT
jgi:hypothetical protein